MDYAKYIIRTLLKEEARQIDVISAIKNHYTVVIKYDSNDGIKKGKNIRLIQPVAYGRSKSGNLVIRAFQPLGDTESRIPSWKFFRLDRIKSWNPKKNDTFDTPPEGFNETDDKTMSEVYLIANFNGNKNKPTKQINKQLRQQKSSKPLTLNDIRKKNATQKVNNNDNLSSISDMSKVKMQADREQQTVGPITKNNFDKQVNNDDKVNVNYNTATQNGPVLKNSVKQFSEPENNEDDEIFKTEDPLEVFKKNVENSYNGNDVDWIKRNLDFSEREKENKRRKKENKNG